MDTTLGMSLEHLLREVLLGRNPTEGSAKESPTSLAAVMRCLKLTGSSRPGSAAAATPHMPQLRMTGGAIRRKSNTYVTVAVVEAGVQILPKPAVTAYIPFISLLDVGAKHRACWSHATQSSFCLTQVSYC